MELYRWYRGKRLVNLSKHHLDFFDACDVFDGRPIITGRSDRHGEIRYVSIGRIGKKFYAVVWMRRALRGIM